VALIETDIDAFSLLGVELLDGDVVLDGGDVFCEFADAYRLVRLPEVVENESATPVLQYLERHVEREFLFRWPPIVRRGLVGGTGLSPRGDAGLGVE